jgi:GNAT superfamily N-acetyltransferase
VTIAAVHVRSWQAAYRGLLPQAYLDGMDPHEHEGRWRDILDATSWPTTGVLVAVPDSSAGSGSEAVVGFAFFGPSRDGDSDTATVAELYTLYLDPDVWRRRMGTLLLQAVHDQVRRAGFTTATAWVLDTNTAARSFYEHHAWHFDGATTPHDWGDFVVTDVRYRTALS